MSGRRPGSPVASPSSSPPIPTSQFNQAHAPLQPSGLRASHSIVSSPDEISYADESQEGKPSSSNPSPNSGPTHIEFEPEDDSIGARLGELGSRAITETSALLRKPFEFMKPHAHEGPCNHGTFSPHLQSRPQSVRSGYSGYGFGGSPSRAGPAGSGEERGPFGGFDNTRGKAGSTSSNGKHKKKMSTTNYLAELHGIKNTTTM